MPIFLNREGILKHFDRLFNEAKREIVMVVPYIKLSDDILNKISIAEQKGIEILIVYRENELNEHERKKILSFQNITLLHHPHVHAKCYLNENSMIVCSMNLYDHSIKNNREMGILLDFFVEDVAEAENIKDTWVNSDDQAIEMALEEVQIIINASTIEKKSKFVEKNGFKFEILKTEKNQLEGFLSQVNEVSENKRFSIKSENGEDPVIMCSNFVENVDLIIDTDLIIEKEMMRKVEIRRVGLNIRLPERQLNSLRLKYCEGLHEFKYKFYKVYWPKGNSIKLYRDHKNFPDVWREADDKQNIVAFIKGCNKIVSDLKKINEFQKIR